MLWHTAGLSRNHPMRIVRRILAALAVVAVLAVAALALVLRHDSPCPAAAAPATGADVMQAITYRCYGGPEVLRLEVIPKPSPAAGQMLVRVRAASLNPLDWHYMRGTPYLLRADSGLGAPQDPRFGSDFAGTVEAVGADVTHFHPGDEVFGSRSGSLAQFVVVREAGAVVAKPANASFAEAAAVPVAALTALQALRDKGQVRPGQRVLINGASGGVGTFAVQIAKTFGAEVTGVCGTRALPMVQSIGADHVIDYTREDFTLGTARYDLILDTVGSHTLSEYRRVLTPHGTLVVVGASEKGNWIGPLLPPLRAMALSLFVSQKILPFLAEFNPKDMEILRAMLEKGQIRPVIDRRYGLDQVPAAMQYLEAGHAHGKVVIDLAASAAP
jgi:NADPH:quinone reductase-like Zn-dependent oxidoreductase